MGLAGGRASAIYWAHLLRKLISFSERGGAAGEIGRELLDDLGIRFTYWDQLKAGKMTREDFRQPVAPVRVQVDAVLRASTPPATTTT